MDLLPSFASLPTRKRCVCLPGSEDVDGLSHSIGTVLDTIQSTEQNPTTYAGRIMKFGLAFLVFFAINLWASNLTTSLVSSSFLSGRPESLSDAASRGYTICAGGTFGTSLASGTARPGTGQRWSPSRVQNLVRLGPWEPGVPGNIFGVFSALDKGVCQAAAVSRSPLTYGLQHSVADACDKASVGGSVIDPVSIGMPVATTYEPLLSVLIDDFVRGGGWDASVALGNPNYRLRCPIHAEDRGEADSGDPPRISVQHMLGPLILFGVCSLWGLIQVSLHHIELLRFAKNAIKKTLEDGIITLEATIMETRGRVNTGSSDKMQKAADAAVAVVPTTAESEVHEETDGRQAVRAAEATPVGAIFSTPATKAKESKKESAPPAQTFMLEPAVTQAAATAAAPVAAQKAPPDIWPDVDRYDVNESGMKQTAAQHVKKLLLRLAEDETLLDLLDHDNVSTGTPSPAI